MATVESASPTPTVSILVADDLREWREQVRNILQARPEWQVICEAGDGQQAVHLAAALRPDVVLLDIGMPIVNGIAAARQVREVCPGSRVVFLTQNLDSDIINEARAVGGMDTC